MASSLSNAKLFSAFISTAISRRGFASAAQGVGSSAARSGAAVAKKTRDEMAGKSDKISWVPDPVTGCYRPENHLRDIDAAELRAMLLNQKN